jgi:aminoglycoside phosphotransferase (APT) family kinase protein
VADASTALRWAADALGASRVHEVRSLAFGTTSDMRLLDADGEQVVLRRYEAGWVRHLAPSLVEAEVLALTEAGRALGPVVPRPLAADASGAEAGSPALLMTFLPGSARLHELDLGAAAAALAALHATPPPGGLPEAQEWLDRKRLDVPGWTRSPDAWRALIELARRPRPEAESVFLHRDYHPGNMLWEDGHLSGIVDWPFACYGPAGVDVAHMRTNLALISDPAVAHAFLAAYGECDPSYVHDPWWDAVDLLSFDPGYSGVVAFAAFGLESSLDQIRDRAQAWAEAITR